MKNRNSFTIISVFILTLISFNTLASNLIRFYTEHDFYHLVPPNKITNIYIDTDDNEAEIYVHGYKTVLWKISLEDTTENEALKLVEAIYSDTRKTILNVKVTSFN